MRRAIDFAATGGVALARQVEQASKFLRACGREAAQVVIAPHRICPLGAHSDHQHGPVLGLGIDLHTVLAFESQEIPRLVLSSADFPGEVEIDLADGVRTVRDDTGGWGRYALGAVALLRDRLSATPRGLVGRITGALPGGGLSSSASNVVAQLLALSAANALKLPAEDLVRLARRVENEFAGVACGVLDPVCVVGARRGGLLRIDTAALEWQCIPGSAAGGETRFLVAYSGRSRELAATDFNRRVAECHAAARRLGALAGLGQIERLGELEDDVFAAHGAALPEPERRRAAHFFGERRRVALGAAHWADGDMASFGALMRESCRSSIELYETGSPELIRLQEIWNESEGVLGARFSGAGFGGCSIALVDAAAADDVTARVSSRFRASFPALAGAARVFPVAAADGARVVTLR